MEHEHCLKDCYYDEETGCLMELDGHDDMHYYKPIEGYDGYYADSEGRIIGPGRHSKPSDVLKPWHNRYGHEYVGVKNSLSMKKEKKLVHRLIAEAFIENPNHYPVVRHLDDNPKNNNVKNLAWGTVKDNMRDCINHGRFRYFTKEDIKKANEVRSTPIIAINPNGERIRFPSQHEASRALGMKCSRIIDIVRKRRKTVGGWTFEYAD